MYPKKKKKKLAQKNKTITDNPPLLPGWFPPAETKLKPIEAGIDFGSIIISNCPSEIRDVREVSMSDKAKPAQQQKVCSSWPG